MFKYFQKLLYVQLKFYLKNNVSRVFISPDHRTGSFHRKTIRLASWEDNGKLNSRSRRETLEKWIEVKDGQSVL